MLPSANADAPTSLSNLLLLGPHGIGESIDEVESIYAPRARTAWKEGRRPRLPPSEPEAVSSPQPPLLSTRRCRNAHLLTLGRTSKRPGAVFGRLSGAIRAIAEGGAAACRRRNRRERDPRAVAISPSVTRHHRKCLTTREPARAAAS